MIILEIFRRVTRRRRAEETWEENTQMVIVFNSLSVVRAVLADTNIKYGDEKSNRKRERGK